MNSQSVKVASVPETATAAMSIQSIGDSPEFAWHANLARDDVESDGGAAFGRTERHGAVPHIGREEHERAGHRLDGPAHRSLRPRIEMRFAEFDPALLGLAVGGAVRNGHIIGRTDPAL